MPSNPNDLTTLAKVKTELGIDSLNTNSDTLLQNILTSASIWFCRETGRTYVPRTITKVFNGDATFGLTLPGPVSDVQAVQIDGNSIPESDGPGSVGWTLLEDRVYLVGYMFTVGVANISVTFSTGYDEVPADIDQAIVEMTCWMFKNSTRFGIFQRSLHGGEALTFRADDAPFFVKQTILNYRNVMGVAVNT